MRNLYPRTNPCNPAASPIEQLSNHLRWRSLPWPARHLMRKHGLHAATARTIAELAGFAVDRRQ